MTINSISLCIFREWQMYRAFQTAMGIHKPDIVFILGEFHMNFGNLNHKIPGVFDFGLWLRNLFFHAFHVHFSLINSSY